MAASQTRRGPRPIARARTVRPPRRTAPPGKAPSCDPALAAIQLAKLRAVCLALDDASERLSHGAPSFYVAGTRAFCAFCDNHHGDGRLAVWCAAPEGAQAMLVDSDPDHYFVPPYVAHLGWVGVRLDRGASWDEIAAVLEAAHATRGPRARGRPRAARPRARR